MQMLAVTEHAAGRMQAHAVRAHEMQHADLHAPHFVTCAEDARVVWCGMHTPATHSAKVCSAPRALIMIDADALPKATVEAHATASATHLPMARSCLYPTS
jgi:hypothetical protein